MVVASESERTLTEARARTAGGENENEARGGKTHEKGAGVTEDRITGGAGVTGGLAARVAAELVSAQEEEGEDGGAGEEGEATRRDGGHEAALTAGQPVMAMWGEDWLQARVVRAKEATEEATEEGVLHGGYGAYVGLLYEVSEPGKPRETWTGNRCVYCE
jgi:hypothetical protein